ncbi:hypothetical protein [Sodalis sp. RH16]|uniref:hypothetical protein n=1 Tax=Sodalis sp. RH16 TaxID=3394331 RepID=UPI0039B6D337
MTDTLGISACSPRGNPPSTVADRDSDIINDNRIFQAAVADLNINRAFQTVAQAGENEPAAALAQVNQTVARLLFGSLDPNPRDIAGWVWPRWPDDSVYPDGALTATVSGSRLAIRGQQFFRTANPKGDTALLLVRDADPAKGGYFVSLDGKANIHAGGIIFDRTGFQKDEVRAPAPLAATTLGAIDARTLEHITGYAALVEELLHAALDFGILQGFSAAAHTHITTRTRPWQGQSLTRATDDPHLVRRYGEYIATRHALAELLTEAREVVAGVAPGTSRQAFSQAWDAVAAARLFAILAGRSIINGTIELLGAGATSQRYGFDCYWRDFTAHGVVYPPYRPAENIGRELVNNNKREAAV